MTIIENPQVLDPTKSYIFRSYAEISGSATDIIADLGCELVARYLQLPVSQWDTSQLSQQIQGNLPYIRLGSEDAKKQVLIGPVLIALTKEVEGILEIQYPVNGNDHLKGTLDYYLKTSQTLLVIEAKRDDLESGFVQLAAELIGLHL